MQPRSLAWPGSLLVWAILTLVLSSPLQAQVLLQPEAVPNSLAELLKTGNLLETERRWSDALTHYEEALREHPGHPTLEQRLDLAKMHYDLARRYGDASFRKSLSTLDHRQAIDLYTEVLRKIESHFVHSPDWQRMVARGTRSLDVALTEPNFRRQNLRRVADAPIAAFQRDLYREVGRHLIRNRHDARFVVDRVADLAQRQLGLGSAVVALEYTSGAVGGLDDYSAYLTGDQLRDVYAQIEGNFVGLGIELKAEEGVLLLVHVFPGSPAKQAGLKAGDRILAVDGQNTSDLTIDEAADLLQGEEGTLVEVTVAAVGQASRRLTVRRQHVEVPSIEDVRILDRQDRIGYLKLTSFQKTTTRDLDRALWKLHRQGMRGLIIDVRGNPGGLLTTSVEVADKFVEHGVIVSTRGRSPQEDYQYTAHQPGTWRVPMVLLIDSQSASASEILAAAIRDSGRGRIVGEQSFGKGSVQGIFPLNIGGAGIRLTTAKFYSPAGDAISKVGVKPHIVVRHAAKPAGPTSQLPSGDEDATLQAGIGCARRMLVSR